MTLQQFVDTLCLWHLGLVPVPEDEDPSCPECSSDLDTTYCDSCDREFFTGAPCSVCEKTKQMWDDFAEEIALMDPDPSSSFSGLKQAKSTT